VEASLSLSDPKSVKDGGETLRRLLRSSRVKVVKDWIAIG